MIDSSKPAKTLKFQSSEQIEKYGVREDCKQEPTKAIGKVIPLKVSKCGKYLEIVSND